jgi:hypothetical protein
MAYLFKCCFGRAERPLAAEPDRRGLQAAFSKFALLHFDVLH